MYIKEKSALDNYTKYFCADFGVDTDIISAQPVHAPDLPIDVYDWENGLHVSRIQFDPSSLDNRSVIPGRTGYGGSYIAVKLETCKQDEHDQAVEKVTNTSLEVIYKKKSDKESSYYVVRYLVLAAEKRLSYVWTQSLTKDQMKLIHNVLRGESIQHSFPGHTIRLARPKGEEGVDYHAIWKV